MAWREKIQLNETITRLNREHDLTRLEEPMPDAAKTALADELRKSVWLSHFAPNVLAAKSIAEVNRVLEAVFDTADRMRVWCGMPGF